jgi:hypothetical protein
MAQLGRHFHHPPFFPAALLRYAEAAGFLFAICRPSYHYLKPRNGTLTQGTEFAVLIWVMIFRRKYIFEFARRRKV